MYIASIRIQNYRCFSDTTVEFQPHMNVIIGENNAGKTAILHALNLIFDRQSRSQIDIHDFYQGISPSNKPPVIQITVVLKPTGGNEDSLEDKALVATWLTKLEQNWEAQLVYEFSLSDEDTAAFEKDTGASPSKDGFWATIRAYLRKYRARIYGGEISGRIKAEPDALDRFDFRSLDAIRDASSNLSSGNNALLRSMLQRVIDLGISSQEKKIRETAFRKNASELTDGLIGRIELDRLTCLVPDTGAADGGSPILYADPDETDFVSALRLFVQRHDFKLPVDRNGLGYNNLIYISLILASLEVESNPNAVGRDNAKLFPMLAIEEPEAHLHPALQYKLLKCIRNLITMKQSRQIFITTHSTHVTAASHLDEIVCLCAPEDDNNPKVTYPGRLFPNTAKGSVSKKYVERYLDATKSNLLFSKGVIFVEGIAEQLLIPCLAEYIGSSLEDHHVAIIGVGGSTFKHFLYLFGAGSPDEEKDHVLYRRVACIVDADPMRKLKDDGAKWRPCYPYQLEADNNFEYKELSSVIRNLEQQIGAQNQHISVMFGCKTLEYDLAFANPNSSVFPTTKEIDLDKDCKSALKNSNGKIAQEFATKYLLSVEGQKGESAFDLEQRLRENFERRNNNRQDVDSQNPSVSFIVPKHIEDAIRWVCKTESGNAK